VNTAYICSWSFIGFLSVDYFTCLALEFHFLFTQACIATKLPRLCDVNAPFNAGMGCYPSFSRVSPTDGIHFFPYLFRIAYSAGFQKEKRRQDFEDRFHTHSPPVRSFCSINHVFLELTLWVFDGWNQRTDEFQRPSSQYHPPEAPFLLRQCRPLLQSPTEGGVHPPHGLL
jgi:hypothetical protein